MSEHPVVACYRDLESADAVALGALFARALYGPLVPASAYQYEPVGLSARALPAPGNSRRAAGGQTALRRARAAAGTDVDVREQIMASTGVAGALARDVDDGLDLIVCGSRGRRCPLAAALGSVSAHLVAHARCPVLVVPPGVGRSTAPLGIATAAASGPPCGELPARARDILVGPPVPRS